MAYETKKLVMAVAGGILIAILIISGFVWTGMLPITEAKGLLIIKVKDDPAELTALWLNISAVRVHMEGWGNETWKEIPVVATEPFDLLSLTDVSLVLAVGEPLVGTYTEVRFHIADANATISGKNETLSITAPWVMVKFVPPFKIEDGKVTTVTIDMDVREEPILNARILMPVSIANATVHYNEQ